MSGIMDQLNQKAKQIDELKARFTDTYLQQSSKTDIQAKMDELDRIVKEHAKLYDETNWENE